MLSPVNQPRKPRILFRQGRLLGNARVKEARSSGIESTKLCPKRVSVMLWLQTGAAMAERKVESKGPEECREIRGEQGGSREYENKHDGQL